MPRPIRRSPTTVFPVTHGVTVLAVAVTAALGLATGQFGCIAPVQQPVTGPDLRPVPAPVPASLTFPATAPARPQPDAAAGNSEASGSPGEKSAKAAEHSIVAPVTTRHEIRVDNRRIQYEATAGTLELHDAESNATARVFHVAYTRTGVADAGRRPVTFVFNGGPGSSSVWLHLGLLGPRRVAFDDAVTPQPPPYELVDNPLGLIDISDLVFIDPVGTGLSRAVPENRTQTHLGVQADQKSVGEFIRLWVTENGRWNSPKFLAGESYGTTRAAALVDRLQGQGMSFNGVILISAILDFQTVDFDADNDLGHVVFLPTYAAVAAHHGRVDAGQDFELFVDEARRFAGTQYAQALAAGSTLSPAERHATIEQVARFTGLSHEFIDQANLRISQTRFCKQLLRDHAKIVGRLDARYTGSDADAAGEESGYDPSYSAILGPYTAMMNDYLQRELGIRERREYRILSGDVHRQWSWDVDGRTGYTNVSGQLAHAMRQNPHLQVFVANGYHDLATPFFATERTLGHLQIPDELRANLHVHHYRAGHMMYIHPASLIALSSDLRRMIARALGR